MTQKENALKRIYARERKRIKLWKHEDNASGWRPAADGVAILSDGFMLAALPEMPDCIPKADAESDYGKIYESYVVKPWDTHVYTYNPMAVLERFRKTELRRQYNAWKRENKDFAEKRCLIRLNTERRSAVFDVEYLLDLMDVMGRDFTLFLTDQDHPVLYLVPENWNQLQPLAPLCLLLPNRGEANFTYQ